MPRLLRSPLVAAAALACAASVRAAAQATAAGERHTLWTGGESRSYLRYVPASYRADRPAALVLVFHGAGGRGRGIAEHTGFTALASREGFVAVYPDGLDHRWNDGRGFGAPHDDVGFVRDLLDTLQRELSVDPHRIYATGISNGAMFAYRLACDLPGVLAAIAPVAGAMPTDLAAPCAHTEPVSVLAIQGTADPLLPFAGGGVGVAGLRGRILPAKESIAYWATVDGCAGSPETTDEPDRAPADRTRVRRTAYPGCRDGRSVELYTIDGGGHTWPGGPAVGRSVGRVTRDIDATSLIWAFFARHPKP